MREFRHTVAHLHRDCENLPSPPPKKKSHAHGHSRGSHTPQNESPEHTREPTLEDSVAALLAAMVATWKGPSTGCTAAVVLSHNTRNLPTGVLQNKK